MVPFTFTFTISPLSHVSPCDFPSGDCARSSGGCSVWCWPHGGAGEVPPVSSCVPPPAPHHQQWMKGWIFGWASRWPPGASGSRSGAALESWSQLLSTGDGPSCPSVLRWRQTAWRAVDYASNCHCSRYPAWRSYGVRIFSRGYFCTFGHHDNSSPTKLIAALWEITRSNNFCEYNIT